MPARRWLSVRGGGFSGGNGRFFIAVVGIATEIDYSDRDYEAEADHQTEFGVVGHGGPEGSDGLREHFAGAGNVLNEKYAHA